LTRFEFWATKQSAGNGNLVLDFRPLDVDGSPMENDAAVLAQLIIPRDSIATLDGGPVPASVSPYLVSVDLASFGLFFDAGDLFAFNFSNTDSSGGQFGTGFSILGNVSPDGGPYSAGAAYRRDNQHGNIGFFPWVGGVGDGTVDMGFRTYVNAVMEVPEPFALAIWAVLGVNALAIVWRRQREKAA
jgi:hypothetical protein